VIGKPKVERIPSKNNASGTDGATSGTLPGPSEVSLGPPNIRAPGLKVRLADPPLWFGRPGSPVAGLPGDADRSNIPGLRSNIIWFVPPPNPMLLTPVPIGC
jgi:hypothetical protein